MSNFYNLKANSISGEPIDFSKFRGKKLLIVNTASECGLTPQYQQLQELYEQFGGEKFEILAFPCNDFGGQEPGSAQEIQTFCSTRFKVSFPLFEKVSVKSPKKHPVYQFLTEKEHNGKEDVEISWNFQKFLIDENGNYVKTLNPQVYPIDDEVINWLS
jgi:glutathione peroxidase